MSLLHYQVSYKRGRVQFMDTLPDLVPDGVELDTMLVQNHTGLTITGSAFRRRLSSLNLKLRDSGLAMSCWSEHARQMTALLIIRSL